ncbi:MAG: DUF5696 domain-containing protein [Clostridia bacterium]|nr:DUF5696 domain-containing protein [Clostridia bacterium]
MRVSTKCKINGVKEMEAACANGEGKITLSFQRENIPADCIYIDFCPDFLVSGLDSQGYAVVPRGTKEGGTMLCRFTERADCEYISDSNTMPVFGFKTGDATIFAVVTGMTFEYKIVVGVKQNRYYLFPRFFLNSKNRYEDIAVDYYVLPAGSDYNDMAALYRKIKHVAPLLERLKGNPCMQYAAESIEVRIRMAWKPVPSPVEHQTPENEPAVIVGCDLTRGKRILDRMKEKGIDKAEICLVGIETKGHDGRWPQLMPIEDSIGGQKQLEEFCAYGQSLGYQMTLHTNSTEMYQISADWDENALVVTEDGSYSRDEILWGGGMPYHICSKCTLPYTERNLKDVKNMGFRGVHYIDVLSNFPPRNCYSRMHPMTARQSAEAICGIAERTRELFGGFASEGGFDFLAQQLDYVLYTSYNLYGRQHDICDETIPFWQLVFHGSILYNPSTETVNFGVKDKKSHLKYIEYGGRPLGYFNSKYVGEGGCGNWMGEEDLLCDTEEHLEQSINALAKMYSEYQRLCHLQTKYMVRHEKVEDGVYQVTYSDGTVITVDYRNEDYTVKYPWGEEK